MMKTTSGELVCVLRVVMGKVVASSDENLEAMLVALDEDGDKTNMFLMMTISL